MKHLIEIKILAVVEDSDVAVDRLRDTDAEDPGCPLNILPDLVSHAPEHGTATNTCPFCGGRAEAWRVRAATPEDIERYTWNRLQAGDLDPALERPAAKPE